LNLLAFKQPPALLSVSGRIRLLPAGQQPHSLAVSVTAAQCPRRHRRPLAPWRRWRPAALCCSSSRRRYRRRRPLSLALSLPLPQQLQVQMRRRRSAAGPARVRRPHRPRRPHHPHRPHRPRGSPPPPSTETASGRLRPRAARS
jgi:hypothetical protein